jgi:hypothetical protein
MGDHNKKQRSNRIRVSRAIIVSHQRHSAGACRPFEAKTSEQAKDDHCFIAAMPSTFSNVHHHLVLLVLVILNTSFDQGTASSVLRFLGASRRSSTHLAQWLSSTGVFLLRRPVIDVQCLQGRTRALASRCLARTVGRNGRLCAVRNRRHHVVVTKAYDCREEVSSC